MVGSMFTAWAVFLASAAVIVYAGTKLSRYGDQIADLTGLGGLWIGVVLMAGATSLPEVFTTVSASLLDACFGDMAVELGGPDVPREFVLQAAHQRPGDTEAGRNDSRCVTGVHAFFQNISPQRTGGHTPQ